jgi:TolA-binding protein
MRRNEVMLRLIVLVLVMLSIISFSVCWAQETSLEEAYSLYYKGKKEAAIRMMEAYVNENPDPGAFYFLGYAYYEMEKMDKAAKYFNKAFIRSPFYSPMEKEKD